MKPSWIIISCGSLLFVLLAALDITIPAAPPRLRSQHTTSMASNQGLFELAPLHLAADGHRQLVVPFYEASPNRGSSADIAEQDKYLASIRGKSYFKPRKPLYGIHDNRNPNAVVGSHADMLTPAALKQSSAAGHTPVAGKQKKLTPPRGRKAFRTQDRKGYAGVHDKSGHLAEGFRF